MANSACLRTMLCCFGCGSSRPRGEEIPVLEAKQPDQQAQQPSQGVPLIDDVLNQQTVTSHPAEEGGGKELPQHNEGDAKKDPELNERNLLKRAFSELQSTDPETMEQLRKLMEETLLTADAPTLTELESKQSWKRMEDFVSEKLALATDPTKTKTLDKLDHSLRIVRSIIEVANEPIKLVREAAAAWTGVNVAFKLISNPVTERKAHLDGIQVAMEKLAWYRAYLEHYFEDYNEAHKGSALESDIKLEREIEKVVIDLFKKILAYQIKSIIIESSNAFAVFFRDSVKYDDWAQQIESIKETESDLDKKITKFQQIKDRQKQKRQQREKKRNDCLNALATPDPKADKLRIIQDKGEPISDCCTWVFESLEQWLKSGDNNIFWITGHAGMGKTMLMCDIIKRLEDRFEIPPFYYFCEISKSDETEIAAALRGLIYTIVDRWGDLVERFAENWEKNNQLFTDRNARVASSDILKDLLSAEQLRDAVVVVDALDECDKDDLGWLLRLIQDTHTVKWVISSRSNTIEVEKELRPELPSQRVSLEQSSKFVSRALEIYISKQMDDLRDLKSYTADRAQEVRDHLIKNAQGTFLWVSLACKLLRDADGDDDPLQDLKSLPPGLDSLYKRMMERIKAPDSPSIQFKLILGANLAACRSLSLAEFSKLTEFSKLAKLPKEKSLKRMIEKCGYFFTVSNTGEFINFVHKSARDYLLANEIDQLSLPINHRDIFDQCLRLMDNNLKRDILNLKHPGARRIDEKSERLDRISYACVYWVEHGVCWVEHVSSVGTISDVCKAQILEFLRKHLLHWLEALSLLGRFTAGAGALIKLKDLADKHGLQELSKLTWDAYRFSLIFGPAIEEAPLQVYATALLFSPTCSHVKKLFARESPRWVILQPHIRSQWPSYLHAIEGLPSSERSVAFLASGGSFVSASTSDVDIRDATTSACLQKFYPRRDPDADGAEPSEHALSKSGTKVAWAWEDGQIKVLNVTTSTMIDMAESSGRISRLEFFREEASLASFSDGYVRIWDVHQGSLRCQLQYSSSWTSPMIFLGESALCASYHRDTSTNIQIYCTNTGRLMKEIECKDGIEVRMLAPFPTDPSRLLYLTNQGQANILDIETEKVLFDFDNMSYHGSAPALVSEDGNLAALTSSRNEVHIWTLNTRTRATATGFSYLDDLYFSPSGKLLAFALDNDQIWIWDIVSEIFIHKLDGHSAFLGPIAFSPHSQLMASKSDKYTKVWSINTHGTELAEDIEDVARLEESVSIVSFSKDGKWVATVALLDQQEKSRICLWSCQGDFMQTVGELDSEVCSIAFSWDNRKLAFGTYCGKIGLYSLPHDPLTASPTHVRNYGHKGREVTSLCFSRDNTLLAALCACFIQVCNVDTGVCIELSHSHRWYGLASCAAKGFHEVDEKLDLVAMAFHGNDEVFSVTTYGEVLRWDANTGLLLGSFSGQTHWYAALAGTMDTSTFQNSTRVVFALSVDGSTLHIQDVETTRFFRIPAASGLYSLSVAPENNAVIQTNKGQMDLSQFDWTQGKLISNSKIAYRGYGCHGNWIVKDGREILWLPPDYRPRQGGTAIRRSHVALACTTGRFVLINFAEEPSYFDFDF